MKLSCQEQLLPGDSLGPINRYEDCMTNRLEHAADLAGEVERDSNRLQPGTRHPDFGAAFDPQTAPPAATRFLRRLL